METRALIQSALNSYAAFPPTPMMIHIKFDKEWPTGFRYIKVQKWNFRNSKMNGLIRLKRAFMPVLVTSNFDDDSIKNERASIETPFSHYKYMGNF